MKKIRFKDFIESDFSHIDYEGYRKAQKIQEDAWRIAHLEELKEKEMRVAMERARRSSRAA